MPAKKEIDLKRFKELFDKGISTKELCKIFDITESSVARAKLKCGYLTKKFKIDIFGMFPIYKVNNIAEPDFTIKSFKVFHLISSSDYVMRYKLKHNWIITCIFQADIYGYI